MVPLEVVPHSRRRLLNHGQMFFADVALHTLLSCSAAVRIEVLEMFPNITRLAQLWWHDDVVKDDENEITLRMRLH